MKLDIKKPDCANSQDLEGQNTLSENLDYVDRNRILT